MTSEEINSTFGIKESFELPKKLMSILSNDAERLQLFEKFSTEDLSHDIFTNYFQEQHSNRDQMMQDFTPKEVCDVISGTMAKGFKRCLDVCAGTGGLTISAWRVNPDAEFYAEELSQRAYPLLLFNMVIRNMTGYAINKDVLSGEFFKGFKITSGEKYSSIEEIYEEPSVDGFDAVIMNPPYSLKHEWNTNIIDSRFEGYGYPPTKANDYAFVLHGLYHMADKGILSAVLPHGVLFRGNREQDIRTALINNNVLNAVIGLPEKLFLNTSIPVCIIVLKRDSANALIIDASQRYEKDSKLNRLRQEDIDKILNTLERRETVDKYSRLVGIIEIEKNDFNLNIPRYVSTYEPPPPIDINAELENIAVINAEIENVENKLMNMLKEMIDTSGTVQKTIETIEKHKTLTPKKNGKVEINGQLSLFDI